MCTGLPGIVDLPGCGSRTGGGTNMNRATRKVAGGLTAKRRRFVSEYLKDQNATQAAIRAGYSRKTARAIGSRLLTEVDVQQAIALRLEKHEVTADRVVGELAKMGFSNLLDYVVIDADGEPRTDFGLVSRDQAAAIREITIDLYTEGRGAEARRVKRVRFRLCDKLGALALLGKYLNLFTDKGEPGGMENIAEALNEGRRRVAALLNDGAGAVPA